MSQYSESYPLRSEGSAAEPSATDVARDEAADVGQHAREASGHVAQTATDQARQVAAEGGRQVRDLLGEAQGQARDQASVQQKKAAVQLHSVADELGSMAANGGQSGVVTEFARQAADRLHGAGSWLEQREPADLLDEVRRFARRRTGTFLIGAALAGLAAGRVTRGLSDGRDPQPDTGSSAVTADPPLVTSDPGGLAGPDFPGYAPGVGLVDAPAPAYLEDPVLPPEPGTMPGFEGPR